MTIVGYVSVAIVGLTILYFAAVGVILTLISGLWR